MRYLALPTSAHAQIELRPIVEADIPSWYAYLSLPVVHEHTSWNVSSPDDLAHYAHEHAPATAESALRFAIVERSSGDLVGTIGFHSLSPRDARGELAYDLAPRAWGKGWATHAVTLLTEWAHGQAGITRLQATVLRSNVRSAAVLERCGFAFEGVLQSYRSVRGVPGDFGMYAHVAAG